ncbi:MAG: DinB family protein [Bacteroidota bacterium]
MEHNALAVKIALDNWNTTVANTNKLLNELTDAQVGNDVAPGRNSGTYLLGHLTAVHDRMLPLLGFEEQVHPHFNDVFLTSPDKSGKEMPSIAELRGHWNDTNARLDTHFKSLQPIQWFERHTSVSIADFAKEPHRNRLGVLISRTNHLANHLGQMVFLKN